MRRRPRCRRPACKTLPTSLLTFDGSGLFGTFEALGADAATKIIFPWSSRAPWLSDGSRSESRPNIFGGQDYRLPNGNGIDSHPNIFGGQDYGSPMAVR